MPVPGEHLVFDWATAAGWQVFCAVLAWSRYRFIRFATDHTRRTTLALLAACFEELDGVPAAYFGDVERPFRLMPNARFESAELTERRPGSDSTRACARGTELPSHPVCTLPDSAGVLEPSLDRMPRMRWPGAARVGRDPRRHRH
jgi:hypothetical protein